MKQYFLVDPVKYEMLLKSHKLIQSKNEPDDVFKHPNVKKVEKIDGEMNEILNSKNLSDYEKTEQYNSKLEDYIKNFQAAITNSRAEALFGKPVTTSESSLPITSVKPTSLTEVLPNIPDSYQQQAKRLAQFIQSNQSFSWNENGELKYKDTTIDGSDIVKLLNDAVRNRNPSSTKSAFGEFINALKTEGYPVHKLFSFKRIKPTATKNFSKLSHANQGSKTKLKTSLKVRKKRTPRYVPQSASPSRTTEEILKTWSST